MSENIRQILAGWGPEHWTVLIAALALLGGLIKFVYDRRDKKSNTGPLVDDTARQRLSVLEQRVEVMLKDVPTLLTANTLLDLPPGYEDVEEKVRRRVDAGELFDLRSLLKIGNVEYVRGRLKNARHYYEVVLHQGKEKEKKGFVGAALGNIGMVSMAEGDHDKALKKTNEALRISREVGDRRAEADQLGNVGLVQQLSGDLDKALNTHSEAWKLCRKAGYRRGEARQMGAMAMIYEAHGELLEGFKLVQWALEIVRECDYGEDEANLLLVQGMLYQASGNLKEALACTKQGLAIRDKLGMRMGRDEIAGMISKIEVQLGQV